MMFEKFAKKQMRLTICTLDGLSFTFLSSSESDSKRQAEQSIKEGFYTPPDQHKIQRLYPPHMIKFVEVYEEK